MKCNLCEGAPKSIGLTVEVDVIEKAAYSVPTERRRRDSLVNKGICIGVVISCETQRRERLAFRSDRLFDVKLL